MEVTLEAFEQQLEIQNMYRDDKFVAKLKELQAQYKQTQDAQKALDRREKDLKSRERLCKVIEDSQATFNAQKAAAETKILEDQQHNQQTKDAVAIEQKSAASQIEEAKKMKKDARVLTKQAEDKNKLAQQSLHKASEAEAAAEEHKATYAKRLAELGLKAA